MQTDDNKKTNLCLELIEKANEHDAFIFGITQDKDGVTTFSNQDEPEYFYDLFTAVLRDNSSVIKAQLTAAVLDYLNIEPLPEKISADIN